MNHSIKVFESNLEIKDHELDGKYYTSDLERLISRYEDKGYFTYISSFKWLDNGCDLTLTIIKD